MVSWHVLGSLVVLHHGRQIDPGPPQRRAVLGALLLAHNKPVTLDRMTRVLWDDHPPNAPDNTIQTHVSRLRALFRGSGIDTAQASIATVGKGYQFNIEENSLDLVRFERLTAEARAVHDEVAVPMFEEALGMWRGPMLPEVAGAGFCTSVLPRYEELRLAAYEDYLDTRLRLGGHLQLVPELLEMVHERPTRTRMSVQLMLALYRSGRGNDALGYYRRLRERQLDEAGLNPPVELRKLESLILAEDESALQSSDVTSTNLPDR